MFLSNFKSEDRYDLKQVILESIVIIGLFLMASPLLAFADDAGKSPKESPHTQVTTTTAKVANWPVSIPAQGEVLPWEAAIVSAKTNGIAHYY